MRFAMISFLLLLGGPFSGFWSPVVRADMGSGALQVVASNYPLAYFAERLAGRRAKISFPVPYGVDPAFWKPGADDIARMQPADLILLNGADYEKWLARVSIPRLKAVDSSASFKSELITVENAVTHSHGPGGLHSHGATAYTTWLDFQQAAAQAEAVAQAIIRKRPEWKSLVDENLKSLQTDLASLDEELRRIGGRYAGKPLLGSHPVYQYLARRYGLALESVHWEPDQMPEDGEWTKLAASHKARPARWMLWESRPKNEIGAKLEALGIGGVVFDPCANRPEAGDFLSVMRENVKNLGTALH